MRRLAIIGTITTGLLLGLGLADWLTNYNWSNDQDPLFGNPHILLNDGATVLVAVAFLAVVDRAAVDDGAAEGPAIISEAAELAGAGRLVRLPRRGPGRAAARRLQRGAGRGGAGHRASAAASPRWRWRCAG